jgi:CBS domain-containing protein
MIQAEQLATAKFVRIGSGHSTAEAVGIAFDPAASTLREIVIVVLDNDGNFLGLVEPRDILEKLGSELAQAGNDSDTQITSIRRGLATPVADLIRPEVPRVAAQDSLAVLLAKSAMSEAAYLPVFKDDVFFGVIPVTAIFDSICQLTLSGRTGDIPFLNP